MSAEHPQAPGTWDSGTPLGVPVSRPMSTWDRVPVEKTHGSPTDPECRGTNDDRVPVVSREMRVPVPCPVSREVAPWLSAFEVVESNIPTKTFFHAPSPTYKPDRCLNGKRRKALTTPAEVDMKDRIGVSPCRTSPTTGAARPAAGTAALRAPRWRKCWIGVGESSRGLTARGHGTPKPRETLHRRRLPRPFSRRSNG